MLFTNYFELQYRDLLNDLLPSKNEPDLLRKTRTGIKTLSVFGYPPFKFQVTEDNFPIITGKKMKLESITSELLWFLEGSTNERRLAEIRYGKPREQLVGKRTIWTDNYENQSVSMGYEDGELGPLYGEQFRGTSGGIDQIEETAKLLMKDPYTRRAVITLWNANEIENMALPPCHGTVIQFYIDHASKGLSMFCYQRSADLFLGVPYNVTSYSLLLILMARAIGRKPEMLFYQLGDAHIYENHISAVEEYLKHPINDCPKLKIEATDNQIKSLIFDRKNTLVPGDFKLYDYEHGPEILAPMAI